MTDPCEIHADGVGELFIAQNRADLFLRLQKIEHCLAQLTDEDIWWRPYEQHNAVGNIILHLCGNMRQWLISGITGSPDVRDRPAEFSCRKSIPKDELLAMLGRTINDADAVLASLDPANLLEPRRIQGFNSTIQAAIQDSVSHLAGHTQEMIWITRLRVGSSYRFRWQPSTPEQGASG